MSQPTPQLKDAFFVVEANSFEQHVLWERWKDRVKWEDVSAGFGTVAGVVRGTQHNADGSPADFPMSHDTFISVRWARIDGRLVLFWFPTSKVVSHYLIDNWFEKNCTPPERDGRRAFTDAQNFHSCIHAIERANFADAAAAVVK